MVFLSLSLLQDLHAGEQDFGARSFWCVLQNRSGGKHDSAQPAVGQVLCAGEHEQPSVWRLLHPEQSDRDTRHPWVRQLDY